GDVRPGQTGVYTATITSGGEAVLTDPAVLGLMTTSKVLGSGAEVGSDIRHPNGNVYDQIQLVGPALTATANPGQVLRVSFVDLSDDIVQVEFSGAGAISIVLENASGPAAPLHYTQPGVTYMKGHAGVVIAGADETTYVAVFSVGRAT